jgi:GDP-L-fucose synthase
MYKDSKVLVAGGTGTIGIQLVKQLIKLGSNVTIASLDNQSRVYQAFGPDSQKINFLKTDLTIQDNCKVAVTNQDFVFNLVGIKGSVGLGESKVASYLIPMLRFQTNLMEASYNAGVKRFLFTGSVCEYPQSELHIEENVWNGLPKQNDRIPGIAKRVGEILGEAFELEYGWDAVRVVRPSNVYGPFDDFNPLTAQVIPSLIHKTLSGGKSIKVWGDGSTIRDFIYSEDVAFWMIKALEIAPSNYAINLGSGEGHTIKEIAERIILISNSDCTIEWDSTKPTGDPIRVMSMKRASSVLDYTNRTNLTEGLMKTISWYRSQIN